MSRKGFLLLCAAIFSFLFTGCIEIIEKITVNDNLSGTFSVSIDFGNSKKLIDIFDKNELFEELEREAKNTKIILEQQPGIKNIFFKTDRQKGFYILSFDFEDAAKLNSALYATGNVDKKIYNPAFYKISKHKFRRKNFSSLLKKFLLFELDSLPDESFFDMIIFKSVFSFPDKIRRVSGKDAVISDDGKTAILEFYVSDILENRVNSGIKVKY